MCSTTIPITLNWLRIVIDIYAKFLSDPFQYISCQPHVISNLYSLCNSYLKFPLRRSHFCIQPCYLQSSIQTRSQVSLSKGSPKIVSLPNRTIVSPLRIWESSIWPTQWPQVCCACTFEKEILLLNAKPRLVFFCLLHN